VSVDRAIPMSIASHAGWTLFVSQEDSTIRAQFLAADGTPAGAPLIIAGVVPYAIWSGSTFLIVYHDASGSHVVDASGRPFASVLGNAATRIASDGNHIALLGETSVLQFDEDGTFIRQDELNAYPNAVLSNGTTFMIFGSATFVQTPLGAPKNIVVRQTAEPESPAVMAKGAGGVITVWTGGRASQLLAKVEGHEPAALPANPQFSIAVAAGTSNYLVIWQNGPVYGVRIGSNGNLIDAQPVRLIDTNSTGVTPALTFDGTNYVIGSVEVDGVKMHRFTEDLLPLDPVGIPVSDPIINIRHLSIVSNAERILVTWDEVPPAIHRIAARVMMKSGEAATGILQLTSGLADDDAPIAATNGDGFLVAWSHRSDFATRTVSNDGSPGQTNVLGALGWERAIAWNGMHYIAFWITPHTTNGVQGAVLDSTGALTGPPMTLVPDDKPAFRAPTTIAAVATGTGASVVFAYVRESTTPGDGGSLRVFQRTITEQPVRRRNVSLR
jgi:hypothetical protein